MAQSQANFFYDDPANTAREVEVPNASWLTGMNFGASNAPGIGISTENPNLEESLFPATDGSGDLNTGSWTLLDQGNIEVAYAPQARAAQRSQQIGGPGFVPRTGDQEFTWDESQPSYSESGAASSGGDIATQPANVIRLNDLTGLTGDGNAKLGVVTNATLNDLAVGWVGV